MKKIILLLLISTYGVFGQSISIEPGGVSNPNVKIQKTGIGFDHRSSDGLIGVGTYAGSSGGFVQTHTNHPLHFTVNNSTPMMTLTTNGNFGIGISSTTRKFHVVGTALITGDVEHGGLTLTDKLSVGNGSIVFKINESVLTNQSIAAIASNLCVNQYYTLAGVDVGDVVILNIESGFSTLTVGNVRASAANQVEVKFCNNSNTNTVGQSGINMRFLVFK